MAEQVEVLLKTSGMKYHSTYWCMRDKERGGRVGGNSSLDVQHPGIVQDEMPLLGITVLLNKCAKDVEQCSEGTPHSLSLHGVEKTGG